MGWQDRDYHRSRRDDDDEDDDGEITGHDATREEDDDESFDPDERYSEGSHVGLHPEGPDASDLRHDNEPGFVACPNCRKMIHEDAEQCPRCGHYVIEEELDHSRPVWVWIGLGLALVVATLWALG